MSLRRSFIIGALIVLVALVGSVRADRDSGSFIEELEFQSCESQANLPYTSYVNFPRQLTNGQPGAILSGRLKVPKVNGTLPSSKVPAVVVVHGSGGLDSRGELYSYNLNRLGVATLEVDLWAARTWYGGVTGRPANPYDTVPDVFGALYFLTEQVPAIDASRIGIMGFSWGGVMSMFSASTDASPRMGWAGTSGYKYKFAAHNPHYPICWAYNTMPIFPFTQTTGKNIYIQTGALDDYDVSPTRCADLISTLSPEVQATMSVTVYPGATHGFDRLEPAITVVDPYSHLGAKPPGTVAFTPNFPQTARSLRDTLQFWKREFNL